MAEKIGIIGRKLGMTRIFNDDGAAVPVTVLQVGPCPVTQVKTTETDGYNAQRKSTCPRPCRAISPRPAPDFSAP